MATKNGNKCSYINCNNKSATNKNLSFFRFPTKDKERCITWILNSGRDEFCELQDNQLRSRYLCSNHFKISAFTNSSRKRLLHNNPLAVPLQHWEIELCPSIPDRETNPDDPSEINTLTSEQTILNNEETLEDFENDFQPLLSDTEIQQNETEGINNVNMSPTPRKKKLIKILSRQKSMLKSTRNKFSFIRKRNNQSIKLDEGAVLQYLPNLLSGDPLTFVKMQIRHQRRQKWNEVEKNWSLSMYYKSPTMYRFLIDRGFKLPCIRTIQYWVNVHNIKPGFTNEVFDKLKMKASLMTPEERECVLMCDEMSIKKCLEYNSKFDVIEGFEDHGPLGRSEKIATHALVFMIRGLKYSWKCPVAYVLSNNSIKASSLAILLDVAIERIMNASFSLKVVVSDLGSTNAAALKLLGVSKEKPFYYFGTDKIFCLFDFPHLLKCVRNNLLKHDFVVNEEVVSWNAIREFHEIDKHSMSDCRAAPKLSERHLNPQAFQKMSVKLAAQVFSASVSRGMKAALHLGLLKDETCLSTADFLGRINDITDCMNSKHLDDNNPLKRPLKMENSNVVQCLQEAILYIASWSVVGAPQPPCFDGLIQTIHGVLSLYKEVFTEENSFLLTGRLNQDPLENLFGVLRRRSGYSSNPSAKEFRRNLQHSMSIRLMDPPSSANCEPDGDNTLVIADNVERNSNEASASLPEPEDKNKDIYNDIDISTENYEVEENTLDLSDLEDNVICYIAGWLGKKCTYQYSCTVCELKLLKKTEALDLNREQLIHFKSFTKHDGDLAKLCKPSDLLYKVVKIQNVAFAKLIPKIWSSEKISAKLDDHLYKETEKICSDWWSSECKKHRLYMMRLLIKCKLFNCGKWKTNDLRDQALLKKRKVDGGKLNEKLKKLRHL